MARPTKWTDEEKMMNPLVSFRVKIEVKEQIAEAAYRHGRTQAEQMAQSLEDGLLLQNMIGKVSDHLIAKNKESDPFGLLKDDYKPSEADCLMFISNAVYNAINDDH